MKILVLNSGSSSIKYQLIDVTSKEAISKGVVERIGLEKGTITHKYVKDGVEAKIREEFPIPDHKVGLRRVAELLTDPKIGVISDPNEIAAVGHRIVHGGEEFAETCLIDEHVKEKIKRLYPLAPLHNPANLMGVEVAEHIFPNARQVAVFDTAFHQTMPPVAYRYAIPNELYSRDGIRKFGFHGTSHKYVSERAVEYLKKKDSKIITIHLGNGCSMAAVRDGKSIDTSMGLGPVSGLVMGTRCGDIDSTVIFYMIDELGLTPERVSDILSKESGMKGLTGYTDMRDILEAIDKRNELAGFALELYTYRIKQYIGAYAAIMNGLDAIVFTAGIGENSDVVRRNVCQNMDYLNIVIDEAKNSQPAAEIREIQAPNSKVKILVIPTNEELEIAIQTYQIIEEKK